MIPPRKSMIRYCHPPTPKVGLTRQSCDHSRTLMYLLEGKKRRDTVCFHKMLRKMTTNISTYRLIRGLWLKALRPISCVYVKSSILDLLQVTRVKPFPTYFSKYNEIYIDYTQLNTPWRFKQMIGRLVSLGFPDRPIPVIDYEYEAYLSKFPVYYHPIITDLYRHMCLRNIKEKWHIVWSYLPFYLRDDFDFSCWTYYMGSNRLKFMLDVSHQQDQFSPEEYQLMSSWIERMKFPSH